MSSATLAEALRHHREGRLPEAAAICTQIVQADPTCAEAIHLLGVMAGQTGSAKEAASLIGLAAQLRPECAAVQNDLGVACRNLDRLTEAAVCYERALRLDPNLADAHYNLANLLRDRHGSKLEQERAASHYRRAIQLQPDHVMAHKHLGRLLLLPSVGHYAEALDCFRRLIEIDPRSGEAYAGAGAALLDLGRFAEAEPLLRRAVELLADNVAARCNLGRVLRALDLLEEAEAIFRKLRDEQPDSVEMLNDLATSIADQGRMPEAMALFAHALELDPNDSRTHCNLGHALQLQDRFQESIAHLRQAVELKPDFADAWNNLAGSIQSEALCRADEAGLDEAAQCYARALDFKPDEPRFHVNAALLNLVRGRLPEGWQEYEWRLRAPKRPREFARPMWHGEPLDGQTILLHSEQGLGDTIQFVRFAAPVRQLGARVILLCQKALRGVLAGCAGIDLLLSENDIIPWFDVHAPLMSLPSVLGTTLETIPAGPYVLPDPDLTVLWKQRLAATPGLRVGIAWQGNPGQPCDTRRSVPLRFFEPLARIPGIRLFSLQINSGSEQLEEFAGPWGITDLGLPFIDTAAAMMSLDLIVTCDTAIGHLAGALGRPVWLALTNLPEWRWMAGRSDSPWYPRHQLFRQPAPGQWSEVFDEMAACLSKMANRQAANNPA